MPAWAVSTDRSMSWSLFSRKGLRHISTTSNWGVLVAIAATSGITQEGTPFGKDRSTELAMHPTVKPLALVADAILDCSKRGGIILDAFAGSGTTPAWRKREG
jgi:DNA modification methylase